MRAVRGLGGRDIESSGNPFFLANGIRRTVPGYGALMAAPNIAAYQAAAYALEGYSSVEEMHARTNPMRVADDIRVPLLMLNTEDDPVCVWQNVLGQLHLLEGQHDRILVSTSHGSHCAHLEGFFWPAQLGWHERLAIEYLDALLAIRAEQAAQAVGARA